MDYSVDGKRMEDVTIGKTQALDTMSKRDGGGADLGSTMDIRQVARDRSCSLTELTLGRHTTLLTHPAGMCR